MNVTADILELDVEVNYFIVQYTFASGIQPKVGPLALSQTALFTFTGISKR
jgi:hypothetical protein